MARDRENLPDTDLADDLLWGVDGQDGIAAFLKLPVRRAYYLIEHGGIPVRKHSHKIISASKSVLRRHFGMSDAEA